MARKTRLEMEKQIRLKAVRSLTRLKHALNADLELNDKLDDVALAFDKQVQQGVLPSRVDIAALERTLGDA